MRSGSSVNGRFTRLTMKPGRSAARTAVLCQLSTSAVAPAVTASAVSGLDTTSTNRRPVDVIDHDLVAVFERDLSDAGAHRARADDPDQGLGQFRRRSAPGFRPAPSPPSIRAASAPTHRNWP